MSMFHRRKHEVPGLNTSSLPDLIFTVLFFFMIVTHMREVTLRVAYQTPQGHELSRLAKKSAVTYIYIGRPVNQPNVQSSPDSLSYGPYVLQLNDKIATPQEVMDYIAAERSRMSAEDQQQMTVSIRADRNVPMGIIMDVKQALRQAKVTKINYSAQDFTK